MDAFKRGPEYMLSNKPRPDGSGNRKTKGNIGSFQSFRHTWLVFSIYTYLEDICLG